MASYAIGDIQGCFNELEALLDKLSFSSQDTLWLAGDLVNRGPKSLEVLTFAKHLGDRAKIVLGNHDLHLLAVYFGSATTKRGDTLDPILNSPHVDELMHWLRQQPLLHYDSTSHTVMTHAGIPHIWSLEQACNLADEVSRTLCGNDFVAYFEHMYGNIPSKWQDDLSGQDRLRCITNYLTRMRFCNAEGNLDLVTKGEIGSQQPGYLPWFELHTPDAQSPHILFGHWAALQGECPQAHIHALDTGCVWGEKLTAIRLEDRTLFSVDAASY